MHFRRLYKLALPTLRRFVSCVVLAAYLGTVWGIPLPDSRNEKDRSTPYPCMNNPCGCKSAADCWAHCCCTTLKERVAWAVKHNVPIPREAKVAFAAEHRAAAAAEQEICSLESLEHKCEHGCCKHPHKGVTTELACTDCRSSKSTGSKVKFVLGVAALKCQGLATSWTVSGVVLPPAPTTSSNPLHLSVLDRVFFQPELLTSIGAAPPVPPPRILLAICV